MRKAMITILTILIVSLLAVSAYSWNCGGMYNNNGYNNGMYGNYYNGGYNNSSYQSFMTATQALRSSIAADRAELNALMANTNPDSKRARVLSEQISKSENELRNKAREYHVSDIGMREYGRGWTCGITNQNNGIGGCW